jgi:GPH family glycoside/pentoside/hexuronide:cation symporter
MQRGAPRLALPGHRAVASPANLGPRRFFSRSTIMPPPPRATTEDDRVPWTQVIAYGMGGVIPIALFNIAGQLMGVLGNISLGLSAFWLGTIMIIPRLWDAVSDLIMGHISDISRTRWGRRRPYILLGGILVALSFVAMWWVPQGDGIRSIFVSDESYKWFQLAFILCGLLLFFTACNIFEIPHGALGMEMSNDYHERTRLFSAKSFLGNLFAMGTPWLMFLAGLDFFRGPAGSLTDGMRYVSLFIAAALIPMSVWWFRVLKEPEVAIAVYRARPPFWVGMRTALSNATFLRFVGAVFTLAMGFNFVSLFSYYITIFYLFGGDSVAATRLLGIAGTTWAITSLAAVVPLNWLSRRWGKHKTLLLSIAIMYAAQLSKIFCYDPSAPYLLLIPTALLAMGMLMFFTLAKSMLGDICDENELTTGQRAEGTFYSVYWWFIKLGTAFASFVTGALLLYTHFDEKQNVIVDGLLGNIAAMRADVEHIPNSAAAYDERLASFDQNVLNMSRGLAIVQTYFHDLSGDATNPTGHASVLTERARALQKRIDELIAMRRELARDPTELMRRSEQLNELATHLKEQAPETLLRLRVVEIGLPLLLCVGSVLLLLRYPLTEARCYEIKADLQRQRSGGESEGSA